MENTPRRKDSSLPVFLYFLFKIFPMVIAGFSIFLGYRLFILGVTGEASLVVNSKELGAQLVNAAPGIFFATGGIIAVIVSIMKGVSINFEDETTPPPQLPQNDSSHTRIGGGGAFPSYKERKWSQRFREPFK